MNSANNNNNITTNNSTKQPIVIESATNNNNDEDTDDHDEGNMSTSPNSVVASPHTQHLVTVSMNSVHNFAPRNTSAPLQLVGGALQQQVQEDEASVVVVHPSTAVTGGGEKQSNPNHNNQVECNTNQSGGGGGGGGRGEYSGLHGEEWVRLHQMRAKRIKLERTVARMKQELRRLQDTESIDSSHVALCFQSRKSRFNSPSSQHPNLSTFKTQRDDFTNCDETQYYQSPVYSGVPLPPNRATPPNNNQPTWLRDCSVECVIM